MEKEFNIMKLQKRGSAAVNTAIGIVVLLILISALAPTALKGMFNSSLYCADFNCTANPSVVPSWVPIALGSLGAIAFVYIIWKAASSK